MASQQEVENLAGHVNAVSDGKMGLSVYLDADTLAALKSYRDARNSQYADMGLEPPTFGALVRSILKTALSDKSGKKER